MTAWNADSLLADPAISDRLGKEPTISGSDREGFGKKLLLVVGTIPFIVWRSCHLAPRGEDTHQYLKKHLSEIVVDGRIGKKSIALVLTGIDIPFDEKGVEIDLATDNTKLTTQIEVLKKCIENELQVVVEDAYRTRCIDDSQLVWDVVDSDFSEMTAVDCWEI
ncbi:hypothetical protein B0H14DRAFT_2650171 [Mycena olivaceomarginata]|nr:hypothetical protein B0H14DRAFT_2650171 [Mycena olivaceomarginata]